MSRIGCIQEIRDALAPQYAEEWARESATFAGQLESDRTRLSDGIRIVHEWVRLTRRFLHAMGAMAFLPYPLGSFATPACPDPPPAPAVTDGAAGASQTSARADSPAALAPPLTIQAGQVSGDIVLAALTEFREMLRDQKKIKESYSTAEVAEIVRKSEYTVREWCRLGRIHASKRQYSRGAYPEWLISHDELVRVQNEGLLPIQKKS